MVWHRDRPHAALGFLPYIAGSQSQCLSRSKFENIDYLSPNENAPGPYRDSNVTDQHLAIRNRPK